MKIALASPPFPKSIDDGLLCLQQLVKQAAGQGAEIICFPESYLPGYRGLEYEVEKCTAEQLEGALNEVCRVAKENQIAIIVPMDWYINGGFYNVVQVIAANGELLGYQTKNQLDPSEDATWLPGTERSIFEVNGVKFGIAICHEGFRYPETVRWAVRQGAKIVFHPHFTGSDISGPQLSEWGNKHNPYYEKAIMMRALENTIYFASVNYATKFSESGTALIAPDGSCVAHQVYGEAGITVAHIDPALATGLLAKRFKPEAYSNS